MFTSNHVETSLKKDADRTNRAADHVINIKIVDEFSQDGFATMTGVLEGGCYDRQHVGMNTQKCLTCCPQASAAAVVVAAVLVVVVMQTEW